MKISIEQNTLDKDEATQIETPHQSSEVFDRVIQSVPYPEEEKLKISDLFDEFNRAKDINLLKNHLFKEGRLEDSTAIKILETAESLFKLEPNLVEVQAPCVIVGDIHGQFYDLLQVLEHGCGSNQSLSQTRFLFLGDYVDRGQFSIEVVLLLWYLKIAYPANFNLLRGNHECKHLTDHFTFKRECEIKYSLKVYDACIKSFYQLPLAAVVNKQFICIHGGLSPEINTLDDINKIKRVCETPPTGPLCDLLWSDPAVDYDAETCSKVPFQVNLNRGCSYFYSYEAVIRFLKQNNLICLIRAHEAQEAGFKFYRKTYKSEFPSLITLFSACNYCDVYRNKGAIIKYENNSLNIKQYSALPHPYWLPNFMDVFTWSLPFIAEKLTDILLALLNYNVDSRKEVIKTKIQTIGRLSLFYKQARAKSISVVKLNGLVSSEFVNLDSYGNKPLLEDAGQDVKADVIGQHLRRRRLSIDEIKQLDKANECMPRRVVTKSKLITKSHDQLYRSKSATDLILKPLTRFKTSLKRSSSADSINCKNKTNIKKSQKNYAISK